MHRPFALAILAAVTTPVLAADPKPIDIVDMPPAERMQDGTTVESHPFGGSFSGRALWLSANGRFAALFRVTDDTDKNGELNIEFGMHGESFGDELALDVFDIETNKHQRYDDLLSGDPTGRYAVLRRGKETLLLDSVDGSVHNLRDLGGSASADQNRCMSPRQIAFDDRGEQIALLNDQPAELVLYSTATGKSRVAYRAKKPLWRVGFTSDPSWMLAIEATGKFPVQRTSCVSRSRRAFAASYSTSAMNPDEISYAFIDAQGNRHTVADAPILLSGSAYLLPQAGKLMRFEAAPVEIPAHCKLAGGADGSRVALLECGKTMQVLDPVSETRYVLPESQSMAFLEGMSAIGPDSAWYAVTFPIANLSETPSVRLHVGRMRPKDLRIERGPAVYFAQASGNPDWLVAGRDDDYYLMHISTGTILTARAKDTETHGDQFALQTAQRSWLLLDPDERLQAPVRTDIEIGNGHGCFLGAAGNKVQRVPDIGRGPWTRYCVSKLP